MSNNQRAITSCALRARRNACFKKQASWAEHMRKLNYELMQLCRDNKDGSFATQSARSYILAQAANDLHELGYRHLTKNSLKPKHVTALLDHWKAQGTSAGTLKNRTAHLRWWARHTNKQGLLPKENRALGVSNRTYVTNVDKSQRLDGRMDKITDRYVKISLQLQASFGLRREESIKFIVNDADKGDHIALKPSWTKGGRARMVPIRTQEQRRLLDECRSIAGKSALISPQKNYAYQLKVYENQTAKAGFHKMHGLRHRYAQERYHELTGWKAPVDGGPKKASLSADKKQLDNKARQKISRELGHERMNVVSVYIGS